MTGPKIPPAPTASPWHHEPSQQLLDRIEDAGILGMGGGGFPAAKKLRLARANGVVRLIANAVECEPGIHCDEQLLREQLHGIMIGMQVVAHLLSDGRCVSSNAVQAVLAYAADFDARLVGSIEHELACYDGAGNGGLSRMAIARAPAAGAERSLCQQVFGQCIPATSYPIAEGILCFNVASLFAIGQAVTSHQPLTQRLVTVNGSNQWVKLGTPLRELLPNPTDASNQQALRVGGHYTGRLAKQDEFVTATTNAIWLTEYHSATPCTQCGWCADVCPESLLPQVLLHDCAADGTHSGSPLSRATQQQLWQCTECGLCNSVCPSHIDLLHVFKQTKTQERQRTSQQALAQRAQQRYAQHQLRAAERSASFEQRRQQRQRKLTREKRDW